MKKENLEKVLKLRKELHNNPEISEQEVETRKRLIKFLKENSSVEIVDKGRWFYAIKREEGATETIAFRADHDAIRSEDGNAFHGCGHDGHSATLAALVLELEGETTGKNIVYLFQHAEENGAGAKECVDLFKEFKVDRIYGYHNWPHYEAGVPVVKKGTFMCASKGFTVSFVGKQSHASEPENGINPVYSIAKLAKLAEPLKEYNGYVPTKWEDLEFSSMTLCTIVHTKVGEQGAFGVSPSRGEISFTLRAAALEDLNALEERLRTFAEEEAKERNMEVSFSTADEFPDTTNDDEEVDRLVNILKDHGVDPVWMKDPIRSSEDFGWYQKEIPGVLFFVGSGVDHPDLHTIKYEFPDEILPKAVDYMAWIALA